MLLSSGAAISGAVAGSWLALSGAGRTGPPLPGSEYTMPLGPVIKFPGPECCVSCMRSPLFRIQQGGHFIELRQVGQSRAEGTTNAVDFLCRHHRRGRRLAQGIIRGGVDRLAASREVVHDAVGAGHQVPRG
jgi:hypothetical protein